MKNKLLLFSILIGFLWFTFVSIVFIDTLHESPLKKHLIHGNGNTIKFHFPQGWGFFTRSPRESKITLYAKQNGKWMKIQGANASPKRFFGLDKTSRAMGIEYGRILSNLKNPQWHSFKGMSNCFKTADTLSGYTYRNNEKLPLLENEIILVAYEPIPWAWRNSFDMENIEGKILKISLQ